MLDCRFSFIVPVYNAEKYLDKCLDSICSQTYQNIEIILIHDETGDKSGEICDRFASLDDRVKVIHRREGGVSDARNLGIEKAVGEYIVFVDADDWIDKDYCKTMHETFLKNENIDVILVDYYEYDREPRAINTFNSERMAFETRKDIKNLLVGVLAMKICCSGKFKSNRADALGSVWAKAYRRECIEKLCFVGNKCEDILFNLYALQNSKKVIYIRKNFYYYRKNLSSACNRYNAERVNEYLLFYDRCKDFINTYGGEYQNEYENALYARIMMNFLPITKGTIAHPMNQASFAEKKKQLYELAHEFYFRNALEKYEEIRRCLRPKVRVVYRLLNIKCYGGVLFLASLKYRKNYIVERYMERAHSEKGN